MTTLTTTVAGPPTRSRVAVHPLTFRRLVAAEWIKLRSLRSTWWTLGVGVVLGVAFAGMQSASISALAREYPDPERVGSVYATAGIPLAMLAFCTFGVLTISGEYGTGQIRSTLAAAPTRVPALLAKLLVTVLAVLAASVVMVAAGWAVAAPSLAHGRMPVDLGDPDDLRIMLGVPLFLATAAALAFAIGALVRSSAAGITVVLGLMLVVENGLGMIPWQPLQAATAYLPTSAGARLVTHDHLGSVITGITSDLPPWTGYGVMLAWALGALAVAAVLLRRRDA
ncbi:ABC transporter permease subunit [Cellulomonas shaoxiangyii]|uniref:ABC transporter permease n=1 Tax=Cellulomonas shaoxiangyii TaxID=2566013 RepID=A0A4P7SGH2_9CELL|nr:ABC transporter permease subunit [Cellulomonas shaoxiangyii]QCB92751.1 ABC transporter permease [Cellulomonas shaoxiangyii]TGY81517.1 ABC transporter permease [Cellulomonas shaoxiangyii]